MLYENVEQAALRLNQTVVIYDGTFVEIAGIGTFRDFNKARPNGAVDICVKLYDPTARNDANDGRYQHVPLDDPRLKYTDIRLGYFNTCQGAFYATRRPARVQRQGLARDNTLVTKVVAGNDINPNLRINDVARTGNICTKTADFKELADCLIKGEFPKVADAIKFIKNHDNIRSRAVSRSLCLLYDTDIDTIYVLNRGVRIGMWFPKSGLNLNGRNKCFAEEAGKVFPKVTINDEAA